MHLTEGIREFNEISQGLTSVTSRSEITVGYPFLALMHIGVQSVPLPRLCRSASLVRRLRRRCISIEVESIVKVFVS